MSADEWGPELWDVLDAEGRPTGQTVARRADGSDPAAGLPPGVWHRVVAVGVFNSRDELLIQQRAVDKVEWPGAWDITAGGSVVAGESSQQGAARELWEEVGIAYDFTGVPPHLTVTSATEFLDIYLIDLDCDPAALQLQTAEVQAVRWAGRDEVLALVDAGTMCRYHKPLVELVFALRRSPGWENQLADGSAVRPGRRPQPGSQPRQNRPI